MKDVKFFNFLEWKNKLLLLEKISPKKSVSYMRKRFFSCKRLSYLDRIRFTLSKEKFKEIFWTPNQVHFSNPIKTRKLSLQNNILKFQENGQDLNLSISYSETSIDSSCERTIHMENESQDSIMISSFDSFC